MISFDINLSTTYEIKFHYFFLLKELPSPPPPPPPLLLFSYNTSVEIIELRAGMGLMTRRHVLCTHVTWLMQQLQRNCSTNLGAYATEEGSLVGGVLRGGVIGARLPGILKFREKGWERVKRPQKSIKNVLKMRINVTFVILCIRIPSKSKKINLN